MSDKLNEIKRSIDKATPGPWHLGPGCIYRKTDETIQPVCITPNDDDNGFLIAKSPEYITYLLQVVEEQKKALDSAVNLLENTKKNTSGIWRISINDFLRTLGKE